MNERDAAKKKQKNEEIEMEELKNKQAATPQWTKGKGELPVKVLSIDKEKLVAYLKQSNLNYEETEKGYKVNIEGNKQLNFNLESGEILLPDVTESTLKKAAEITAKSGAHTWDLSRLSKDLEGTSDKNEVLQRAYKAAKNEGLNVTGLDEDLAKKFNEAYESEKKPNP